MHASRCMHANSYQYLLFSCFTKGSYLRLVFTCTEDAFWVIVQIHIFHYVMHCISHFFHFIEREESFDDKEAICFVLKGINWIFMSLQYLRL